MSTSWIHVPLLSLDARDDWPTPSRCRHGSFRRIAFGLSSASHYKFTERSSTSFSIFHLPLVIPSHSSSNMPSDAIYRLATDLKTVTAAMEQNPTGRILDVAYSVFTEKPQTAKRSKKLRLSEEFTPEDLDRAEQCGKFPYRPSDLFLKVRCARLRLCVLESMTGVQIYSNVLDTLEHGPLKNMCSPSLMGTSGVVPITVNSLYVSGTLSRQWLRILIHFTPESQISCDTTRTLSSPPNTRSSWRQTTGSPRGAHICASACGHFCAPANLCAVFTMPSSNSPTAPSPAHPSSGPS